MSIASFIIGLTIKQSAKRFEKATLHPETVQEEKLLSIVRKNSGTEYGQRYGFSSIRTIEDFQQQVPMITYEDIKSDMQRVVAGEKNIFTAEDPIMFAQTSGTTGDPKYIPVTPTCQGREHSDQMRTWTYHARQSHPDVLSRKVVSLVSPAIEGYTPSGIPFGSTSGHIYKNMPALIRSTYSIPYDVFEIEDYGAKYYTIMRISLEHDVSLLATANPSSVIKMCEKANMHSEDIIRDIRDGTLSEAFAISTPLRKAIAGKLKPNARRAAELEKFRSNRDGELRPVDYWQQLSLIGCWKGGSVGHYLKHFPYWFDPDGNRAVPVRDMGYLSSEARGSIPLSDEGSKGVLTISTNFMEFVAVDDLESKRDTPSSWRFLTVGEIEQDKEYYIFFTTTSGLYRYDINDVVKVVGCYNNTPEIVFVRKGRGMTNITGEKVSVNQVITAFQKASEVTGAHADHFKAEADQKNSRYIFRVEFTTSVEPAIQQKFISELDQQLKSINIEYKAKRDSQRLGSPIMHIMREGWYERNRKQQVEGGMRAFQAKTQLLSPDVLATQHIRPELEKIVELEE
ncbi:GH3 auxin-responsive promoter family protein [Desulfosediminicola flagellatus]|uniref:GH3 auxin-responsive promoter family protein n=1 Tax=Desulfosediminicola flagellatus TaxID=2569541 RepID=UPI0010AB9DE8|nr:GH3 auxin-responsive promoter family protein [Desulfosediminicola flagellatus]